MTIEPIFVVFVVVYFMSNAQEWKFLLTCPEPENEQIPFFDTRNPQGFTPFHRLVLLRFLRPGHRPISIFAVCACVCVRIISKFVS